MAKKEYTIFDRTIADLEKKIIERMGEAEGRKWIDKIKADADDFVKRNFNPLPWPACKVNVQNLN